MASGGLGCLSLLASMIALCILFRYKLMKMQPYRIMAYSLLFSGMLALSTTVGAVKILVESRGNQSSGNNTNKSLDETLCAVNMSLRVWSTGALFIIVSATAADICCLAAVSVKIRGSIIELVLLGVCVCFSFPAILTLLLLNDSQTSSLECWINHKRVQSQFKKGGNVGFAVAFAMLTMHISLLLLSLLIHFSCVQILRKLIHESFLGCKSDHVSTSTVMVVKYRQALKEVAPLLVFPSILPFTNYFAMLMYLSSQPMLSLCLTFLHLLTDSMLGLLNGTTVILHVYMLKPRKRLHTIPAQTNIQDSRTLSTQAFLPSTSVFTTFRSPNEEEVD